MKRFLAAIVSVSILLSFQTPLVQEVSADQLLIRGSSTILPIVQKMAGPFARQHPDIRIALSGGGSGYGIKAIIDDTTAIAMASSPMRERDLLLARKRGVAPKLLVIAHDCVVPVAHPDNPVARVSLEQLRSVYGGRIDNWKALGGPDRKIAVVSRDTSSGTYAVWQRKVMGDERVFPGALLQASNGAVVQAVSRNPAAIGYIGHGYLNDSVKPLEVDNVPGTPRTALDGTYPISRPLYLYTPGEPREDAKAFIRFTLSGQGQELVRDAGFAPLEK